MIVEAEEERGKTEDAENNKSIARGMEIGEPQMGEVLNGTVW